MFFFVHRLVLTALQLNKNQEFGLTFSGWTWPVVRAKVSPMRVAENGIPMMSWKWKLTAWERGFFHETKKGSP